MRSDQDIYNDIGSVLLSITPSDAVKIILCANASERLLDLLVELRNLFVDNFKSQEKPFWHGCEVTVNIETLKINIDFKYEN